MKISIFTSATRPYERGDTYDEAIACYKDLADEVIEVGQNWAQEFSFDYIGKTFNQGYELCTGDWVIHADLDFIFHENDMENIRKVLQKNNDAIALSFWKYQFVQPHRYNLKSRLVIAVNKAKYGNHIQFNAGGDLCQPSFDGQEIKPNTIPEARIAFYNYEKITKTREQALDDIGRMNRAYFRYFGEWLYASNESDEDALEGWLEMMRGRQTKPQSAIPLVDHPKYMIETIRNLTPDQFGYDGWGNFERNDYA